MVDAKLIVKGLWKIPPYRSFYLVRQKFYKIRESNSESFSILPKNTILKLICLRQSVV